MVVIVDWNENHIKIQFLGMAEGSVSMVRWMRSRWSMIRVKSALRNLLSRYISMVLT